MHAHTKSFVDARSPLRPARTEWAIFSVYSVIKTSAAGDDGVVARHPSCRGHKERQREKKNEVLARKWQRRRAPLKRRSKHKIMKSEVEGNTRRTHMCSLFFCFFTRTHRLICLSFPPSFKHLSSSSPFVRYQHIWRCKKNCTGWWVGSRFHWYIEITVNLIYILSGFSLIFFFCFEFHNNHWMSQRWHSSHNKWMLKTCQCVLWCPWSRFTDLQAAEHTHTQPSTELPETYCLIAVEATGTITDVHLHLLNYPVVPFLTWGVESVPITEPS